MGLSQGLSVVVPVYRSERTLRTLVDRVSASLAKQDFEIILVDDASGDGTWREITTLAKANTRVKGLRLGRNSGQHSALLAGVRVARFATVVTLDDDLQNPPEEISKLLAALSVDVDVVYGVSTSIKQNFYRRLGSKVARKFFASMLGFGSAISMSSFRVFRTELRSGFDSSLGPNISLDALLTWSTSRFAVAEVAHDERAEGTSHYTFRKLVRFMMDMATGYSTLPLRMATAIGFTTIVFGLLLFVFVAGRPLIYGDAVPGFPMLASSITIFSGVQILLLGVLGEYIGRMHFRVMNKPTYMIAETTTQSTTETSD
ncbi:undecaprenyl-phosphate 4-deoxy-4-formamido-L-arabinose transferase [Acidimicrobiaceae bacterium]|nr:undecaprenyl-phosphate 4-deoxy-4-formamido-L-arabinose transferase [Acidimicrobiaceae bacterium]